MQRAPTGFLVGAFDLLNLPRAKAGGFLLHTAWLAVARLICLSTGVLRLYDSHSDELSNTFFSQILSSVEIPAVLGVALRAYPLSIGETEVFVLVSTVGAQLG